MFKESESECIRIRAHHLFCMQGFQGYGYSSEFVANMRLVLESIKASPSGHLKLVSECDAICVSCPNKKECSLSDSFLALKIRKMDQLVLEKLGMEEQTVGEAKELFRLVNKKLKNPSDIEEVCGSCRWRQKCLWYLQKNEGN